MLILRAPAWMAHAGRHVAYVLKLLKRRWGIEGIGHGPTTLSALRVALLRRRRGRKR